MNDERKLNEIELPLLDRKSETEKSPFGSWGKELVKRFQAMYSDANEKEVDENRIVYLDGKAYPENTPENVVKNTKYTPFNFLPKVLYNEFKFFSNLFFLLICLSQFIPPLKVGNRHYSGFFFSYAAPLLFVLFLTMMKEAWDDYKRMKRDYEANSQTYELDI